MERFDSPRVAVRRHDLRTVPARHRGSNTRSRQEVREVLYKDWRCARPGCPFLIPKGTPIVSLDWTPKGWAHRPRCPAQTGLDFLPSKPDPVASKPPESKEKEPALALSGGQFTGAHPNKLHLTAPIAHGVRITTFRASPPPSSDPSLTLEITACLRDGRGQTFPLNAGAIRWLRSALSIESER